MARQYTKKSEYWEARKNASIKMESVASHPAPTLQSLPTIQNIDFSDNEQEDGLLTSIASRDSKSGESVAGSREWYRGEKKFKYANIDRLPLPWNYGADGVDITDALNLVQKCYANIGIARNAIDVMADTANTPFKLVGGTDKSKRFVNLWLKKIDINHIKEQFYQEAFRTGNIFFYKMTGNWAGTSFAAQYSDNVSVAAPSKLPLKYVLMNSSEIVRNTSIVANYQFTQRFSRYELNKLKNPQTEKEKELYKSIKKSIDNLDTGGLTLGDKDIAFAFYGKQDYEPFALPYLWPVLDDINLKLEMKKRDQAVLRLVNSCILLVTSGTKPEEGGVNKENIMAVSRLFQTEAVGRTLVADYTHKGEFIIPDLKKVIYPEKYTIINEDIKEGLANILFGTDAKYGNLVVKVRVFLQKMQKARLAFEKMMQREIEIACEYMGLVSPPEIKTDAESLEDPAVIQKTAIRLLELGVITPEDAIPLLKNREYPEPESLEKKQKPYLDQREDGKWMPMVGGQPLYDNGLGQAAKPVAPKGPVGKPKQKGMASTPKDWGEAIEERDNLIKNVISMASCDGELSEEHKSVLKDVALRVFRSEEKDNWVSKAAEVLKSPELADSLVTNSEIMMLSLANGFSVDDAALWYSAQKKYQENSQSSDNSVVVEGQ
jgi:hypothetical protein